MRALTLNVDGGNHVPTDVAPSREVNADAHQLRLGAISLGAPREDATLQGAISPLTPDAPFALPHFRLTAALGALAKNLDMEI